MKFTKDDELDLLKLADIIEKKEFFNKKNSSGESLFNLPEDKRNGSQFNLGQWFFNCGMPACAAGHAVCEFPERFGYDGYTEQTREDKQGRWIRVTHRTFAFAFNISLMDSEKITYSDEYKSDNPRPKTVANRIRMIVKRQKNHR